MEPVTEFHGYHYLQYYLATLFIIVASVCYHIYRPKNKRFPPGPTPLPLIGNVLQIGRKPHISFLEWKKKYGPIFRIKMGTDDAVVISDNKLMKELLSEKASAGRMLDNPVVHEFTNGPNGVLNSEGAQWEEQRHFMLRTLKDFGFSSTSMDGMILDEAHAINRWFKKSNGQPISGNRVFNAPVLNALWRLVAGERCEWEDTRPLIMEYSDKFFSALNEVTMNGIFFAPFLRLIAPELLGWNRYIKALTNMRSLFDETIDKHKATFNPNDLRDFTDCYLKEMETSNDPNSTFYKKEGYTNMIAVLFDLFVAGSETTAGTLSWTLLYLSQNEEIQERLQQEIDEVLGNQPPSLSQRPAMPYTEAVILEVLRMSATVCIGVPHRVIEDTHFHGYYLPKGMSIFANIYGIQNDPEVWGDPGIFRPERFLTDDKTKIIRHEALVAFSEGKRKCLGETLARNTMFIFVASIFQNFTVKAVKDEKGNLPDFEPDLGILLAPKPFEIIMSPRTGNL